MTATDLSAYRSDREQLLARVRELEAELERLQAKSLERLQAKTQFNFLESCPSCGVIEEDEFPGTSTGVLGWTHPRFCRGWSSLRCWFRRSFIVISTMLPHAHQRCTACGARWIVDAEGWRWE